MRKILNHPWFKLAVVLIILVLVYVCSKLCNIDFDKVLQIEPQALRNKLSPLGIWLPILFFVASIVRPLVLCPLTIVSALAGVIFGPLWGLVYAVVGATLSAIAEFFVARYLGREFIERWLKGKLAMIDQTIERHGFKAVLLIRLIPNVPYDMQNCSLGLTKIQFRDYAIATFIGITPITFLFVYLGNSLTDFANIWKILLGIILLSAIFMAQAYYRKKYKDKKKNGMSLNDDNEKNNQI